jgi:hypothetical protein
MFLSYCASTDAILLFLLLITFSAAILIHAFDTPFQNRNFDLQAGKEEIKNDASECI